MKAFFLAALACTFIAPWCFAAEPSREEIAKFSDEVSEAIQKKDIAKIRSLHNFGETPESIVYQTMLVWHQNLNRTEKPDLKLSGVEFMSLDEYLAQFGAQSGAVKADLEETMRDDGSYVPNVRIVGALWVKFASKTDRSSSQFLVGVTPAGKLGLAGLKPKE